ncbi:UvrD-helicase domain-containing protein [Ferrimicrobium acidiphilum]|uniref:RecBCD enzyme subunit RecB n=1 Tax=Ferrimicrobium acidiphilum DSM 19497 TaxID=1121877 RepID=A0A0D8FSM0_9ACTN|nr:UvrD-helicase domain-containing protein [Ferrimicrobium acidiphilum]KJE76265.1 RecBCD enzyme subunit RecB [Ferrimicrobium acidiphilum DSM 19497]
MHGNSCGQSHGITLTNEQSTVIRVASTARTLIATAKAGTGKTSTVASLICGESQAATRVLALSFSRNGLKEIVSALSQRHDLKLKMVTPSAFLGNSLRVQTFDSMLFGGIRELVPDFNKYRLAGPTEQYSLLVAVGGEEMIRRGGEAGLWSDEQAQHRLIHILDLLARSQALSRIYQEFMTPYINAMEAKALADHIILPAVWSRLVVGQATRVAELLCRCFDLIIVDEFQDCSERDLSPLIALSRLPQGPRLVGLGDPGQAVMTFRGAVGNPAAFFRRSGVVFEERALTLNLRSTPELVTGANSLQQASGMGSLPARTPKDCPSGPEPLVTVWLCEQQLMDALLCALMYCKRASYNVSIVGRLPVEFVRFWERVERGNTAGGIERAPTDVSVTVLVPTNRIAREVEKGLQLRGIDAIHVKPQENPYESETVMAVESWFEFGGEPVAQLRALLTKQKIRWVAGMDKISEREVRFCFKVLMYNLGTLGVTQSRREVSSRLVKVIQDIARYPKLTACGREYLEGSRYLVQQFSNTDSRTPVIDSVADLQGVLLLSGKATSRGSTRDLWILDLLRTWGAEVLSGKVAAFIRDRRENWQPKELELSTSVVQIKTPESSKGDSVDVVIAYHGERIPRPEHVDRCAASSNGDVAAGSQSYVAETRARRAYAMLCLSGLPRFHEVPLEGWQYQDFT